MALYYSLNKILSHGDFNIFVLIGARGRGKTYSIKRHLIKKFIHENKKFILIRDSEVACEELKKDSGYKFFEDVMAEFKGHTAKFDGDSVIIDGKNAGYIMPLTTFYKFKGNAYTSIKNIFFDEFIPEDQQRYNGDRVRQFINSIKTIGRLRQDYKLFLAANPLDAGDNILEILGFKNIKNFGLYKSKSKKAILHYLPNSLEFDKATDESIAGRLVKGTQYENSINKNLFDNDNARMFKKRKPCSLYGIYYNSENVPVRIYEAKDGSEYYACKDINPDSYNYMRFVFNLKQVTTTKQFAVKEDREFLQTIFTNKMLLFESAFILNAFLSIINNNKRGL